MIVLMMTVIETICATITPRAITVIVGAAACSIRSVVRVYITVVSVVWLVKIVVRVIRIICIVIISVVRITVMRVVWPRRGGVVRSVGAQIGRIIGCSVKDKFICGDLGQITVFVSPRPKQVLAKYTTSKMHFTQRLSQHFILNFIDGNKTYRHSIMPRG